MILLIDISYKPGYFILCIFCCFLLKRIVCHSLPLSATAGNLILYIKNSTPFQFFLQKKNKKKIHYINHQIWLDSTQCRLLWNWGWIMIQMIQKSRKNVKGFDILLNVSVKNDFDYGLLKSCLTSKICIRPIPLLLFYSFIKKKKIITSLFF